jgi:hypothetical protein
VLAARPEPFYPDTRLLRINLRITNNMKDLTYDFRVPMGIRTLALRITHMEEVGDIPLHMK